MCFQLYLRLTDNEYLGLANYVFSVIFTPMQTDNESSVIVIFRPNK